MTDRAGAATPAADQQPRARGAIAGRLRGSLLVAAARVVERLPEAPLVAGAEAAGELWYRLAPARAAQARVNLRRVCEGLAASGRGPALARRAAADPEALERLVRAAFRHAARYYLEVASTGGFDVRTALARIDVETPAEVKEALASGRPIVLVGMHFGAIELPAVEVSHLVGHRVMAPMEIVADPVLQSWLVESRGRVGVDIIPLVGARRAMLRALRRGESVGMVADRDILGNGISVPFFGHPAPMPAGPALLAIEAGVPLYAGSARRTRDRRYRGRVMLVPEPEAGTRRERLVGLTAAMAGVFESLLADAPEQWWGAFHPIWPDLDLSAGAPAADPQADAPGADAPADAPGAPGGGS